MKKLKILCCLCFILVIFMTACKKEDKVIISENNAEDSVENTQEEAEEETGEPEKTEAADKNEQQEDTVQDLQPAEGEAPIFCEEDFVITDKAQIMGMTEEILSNMTLEEKIGQLFIVNFELLDSRKGSFYEFTKVTAPMRNSLLKYKPGGVVFFSRNIETVEQVQNFIIKLQKFSEIPLFIAVDEEGGDVARIANNSNMNTTKFPPMEEVGKMNDEEYAYNMGAVIGREMKELLFNLDFAPVADVKTNALNTEIGSRSFGDDPKLVATMVTQVVKGLKDQNVVSVLKHFPGQGDAMEDSHEGAVNVDNDINRLRKVEFVPFKAGIKAGADMIMVSHISIARVTGSTEPASMTELVMKDILRTELSFDGIIITDAMNMKSVTKDYSAGAAAVKAVKAGADIVLMPEDFEEAYTAVLKAVEEGEISEDQIDDTIRRILTLKMERGIITANTDLGY